MDGGALAFLRIAVAHAPAVELCVDLEQDRPLADWLRTADRMADPPQRMFLAYAGPGKRMLDLGSHLGTFSLPAAALGAEVLAVDETARHAEQLRRAAERNGFESVRAVHGTIGNPWGGGAPEVVVDDLLDELGWETLDAVKMDIEGAEILALPGMARLFERGSRPAIVFESNGAGLARLGSSVYALKEAIAAWGYELLQLDHLRDGTLVESPPRGIQPECIADYLAAVERPDLTGWTVEPPFSRERIVLRLLAEAARPGEWYRRYVTSLLLDGPPEIAADPLVAPALEALARDIHREVREVFDAEPREGAHATAEAPAPGGVPAEVTALAVGLTLTTTTDELDEDGVLLPGRPLLRDASFHVSAGELLQVVVDDPAVGAELLRVLAGIAEPAGGQVGTSCEPVLLSMLGNLLEPRLTVADNLLLLAAYVGADPAETRERLGPLSVSARVNDVLDRQLDEVMLSANAAVRMAVTVALECSRSGLLLFDRLPDTGQPSFDEWSAARAAHRRAEGRAMVQVRAGGPSLGEPDRLLWIADGELVACGRPNGILNAVHWEELGRVAV